MALLPTLAISEDPSYSAGFFGVCEYVLQQHIIPFSILFCPLFIESLLKILTCWG